MNYKQQRACRICRWARPQPDSLRREVHDIVSTHHATNPRVFSSAARGDDTGESDLDLPIDPTAETTLLDVGAIRHELLALLGVTVDVLTPKALPSRFRDSVLAEAVPV